MAIVETQNQQPSVNVYPNGNGNGGGGFGGGFGDMFGMGGGGAIFFWLILFFFMMMFMGGWGNNGGNNGGGNGGTVYIPYGGGFGGSMGGYDNCAVQAVRNGFDQSAIIGGINGLQNQIQTGFSNAEVSRCNQQANLLATMNNNQNATNTQLQNLNMGLQNCCCENRAATADLKYTVATEACADRAAVGDAFQGLTAQNNANVNAMMVAMNNGFQSIKDQMCNDKIDQKNERIADLERQLTMANLAASQTAQTAAILANNEAQTTALEQYLAPNPRPAYIVQNPNCCAQNYSPCGCNGCR